MSGKARWALSLLLREATRNVFNLRSRMFSMLLLATVFGSSCALFYALESQTFTQNFQQLHSKGGNVLTYEAKSRSAKITITRTSCEALANEHGVERAGLLIDEGTRDIQELGARISVYTASTSLFPQLGTSDGLLGVALQSSREKRRITLEDGGTRLLVPVPPQAEGIPTNGGIVFPLDANTTAAPTCMVVLQPFASIPALSTTLAAELTVHGGDVLPVRQLTPTSDPVVEWRSRPGQYSALALGFVGCLCTTLLTWTRSAEMAAYRLSGTRRTPLAVILSFEALLIASLFATAGTLAAATLMGSYISAAEIFFWILAGSASWVFAALVGVIRTVTVGAATLTRER